MELLTYVAAVFGLLLMVWVWLRLRHTRYRDMAALSLTIILLYAMMLTAMFFGTMFTLEERYSRYAGIIFLLLLLTAIDQWRVRFAKGAACVLVIVPGLYGLEKSATRTYAQMHSGYYDPMSGISRNVSPAVLEYLRSEATRNHIQRPLAVVSWRPVAIESFHNSLNVISLP